MAREIEQIVKESKSIVISNALEKKYYDGTYELVTIIPYVENAIKRTYILSREELESFLDGYENYNEYVFSIKKLKK